jgi:hypothetical protein
MPPSQDQSNKARLIGNFAYPARAIHHPELKVRLARHMEFQMLRDRLRELNRHRVAELPIPLVP